MAATTIMAARAKPARIGAEASEDRPTASTTPKTSGSGMAKVKKAAATAAIGAAALSQQMTFDQQYSEALATQGITSEQARQGYAAIASDVTGMSALGSIYGEKWGQRQAEEEVFEGKNIAQRQRLVAQEKSAFGGSAGGARSGFAQRGGAR